MLGAIFMSPRHYSKPSESANHGHRHPRPDREPTEAGDGRPACVELAGALPGPMAPGANFGERLYWDAMTDRPMTVQGGIDGGARGGMGARGSVGRPGKFRHAR
jgi:hypothetical protein